MVYRSPPEAPIVVAAVRNKISGLVAATGNIAWTFEGAAISNNKATRIIVTHERVFLFGGGLACLDYLTGQLIWQNKHAPSSGSFILQDGRLFVASTAGQIGCYSASDGTLLWETTKEFQLSAIGAPWNFVQGDQE